jgi:hypothetical protein
VWRAASVRACVAEDRIVEKKVLEEVFVEVEKEVVSYVNQVPKIGTHKTALALFKSMSHMTPLSYGYKQ